jgi:multidrug resistance efflux pump
VQGGVIRVIAGQPLAKIKPDIYQALYDRAVAASTLQRQTNLQAKAAVTQSKLNLISREKLQQK